MSPGSTLKSSSAMVLRAGGGLGALACSIGTVFSGAAVHGVVQLDVLQAEIVLGFHRDGDFLDGRCLEIAARPGDLDLGRLVLLRLDEVVFAEAHVFAAFDGGDVIHGRPSGWARWPSSVPSGAVAQRQLGAVVQHRAPLASGLSVWMATSAVVPSTARRSPPGSSTASFMPGPRRVSDR